MEGAINRGGSLLFRSATEGSFRVRHVFYQDCDPVQRLLVGDAQCHQPVMRYLVIEWNAFGAHDSPQRTRRELVELSVTDVPWGGR
jgi:hypothetical protein